MTNSKGGSDIITINGDVVNTAMGATVICGDVAGDMTGGSTGGDDKITITGTVNNTGTRDIFISGDAVIMDNSKGGDDIITIGTLGGGVHIYGDAQQMTNGSTAGDDQIIVQDFMLTGGVSYIYGDCDPTQPGTSYTPGDDYFELGSSGMNFFQNGTGTFELWISDFGSGNDTLNIEWLVTKSGFAWNTGGGNFTDFAGDTHITFTSGGATLDLWLANMSDSLLNQGNYAEITV